MFIRETGSMGSSSTSAFVAAGSLQPTMAMFMAHGRNFVAAKTSERRDYVVMFMAHGRNFVAAKTSERRDYVVMFMAHEQRNIAQITIHQHAFKLHIVSKKIMLKQKCFHVSNERDHKIKLTSKKFP
jgi:hypothetical protein